MSPEQLDWSADVSPQSDIYSIGAVLCKLLIGTTPLDACIRLHPTADNGDSENHLAEVLDIQKLRQTLLQEEPGKPSRILADLPANESEEVARKRGVSLSDLQQELHKQLDWVVLKALCPQRSDRYPNATALSADLQAVLDHRPTTAGPPSLLTRLSKWSRRNSQWLKNAAMNEISTAPPDQLEFLQPQVPTESMEKSKEKWRKQLHLWTYFPKNLHEIG
jgi:serine/threonine protein kinase